MTSVKDRRTRRFLNILVLGWDNTYGRQEVY